MSLLVEGLLFFIAAVLLLEVSVLALEVVMARLGDGEISPSQFDRPRIAVLIPAHNEASSVAETVTNVREQLQNDDRVMVVADNCTDDTARVAKNSGAEVITRHDPTKRGKGFALDFGVVHLKNDPPEIVIILDADCHLEPRALQRLALHSVSSSRPAQSFYHMRALENANVRSQVAEFAWLVNTFVRPLGLRKLGLPCQLMGSGMAFPWSTLSATPLATENIVEDKKLGLSLIKKGCGPLFCPDAKVTSVFPEDKDAGLSQRTRWEHGHLSMILAEFPGLIRDAITKRNIGLVFLALDLTVPPLALLTLLLIGGVLLFWIAGLLGLSPSPFYIGLASIVLFGATVLLAWARFGREALSAGALIAIPFYVLAKIPIYLRFIYQRQKAWIRTERDHTKR